MANEQNLRPPFTPEEAREYGRKGAAKAAELRAQKKTFAAMTKKALQQKVTDAKQLEIIKKSGITKAKNPTYMDFLIASVIMKSIKKGSVDDILKYQQIIGEKPNIEASPTLDT